MLVTALVLGAPAPHDALVALQEALTSAIAKARPSVVEVRALHPGPGGLPVESAGAGVIVDPSGLVITNQHVVAGAVDVEVRVYRSGGPAFRARVIAADAAQDLAMLALVGRGPFTSAALGRADGLRIGERVIAIGTPLGLAHSASAGIVSDRARTLRIAGRVYPAMIQTDATINQGNSGGPLIDLDGRVVGLVTAIFAPEGASTGVAFAIPAERLTAYIASVRAQAGARLVDFTKEPIRIGQRRPHPFAPACNECHEIREKLAISIAQQRPHPSAGDCTTCHVFNDMPGAGAPAAGDGLVAYQVPLGALTPVGLWARSRGERSAGGADTGLAALAVFCCIGAWLWFRRRVRDEA